MVLRTPGLSAETCAVYAYLNEASDVSTVRFGHGRRFIYEVPRNAG